MNGTNGTAVYTGNGSLVKPDSENIYTQTENTIATT